MRTKLLISFALSFISIVTASADFDDDVLEDFSTVKGNGNYIVQLHPDITVKTFVPKLLTGAIQIFSKSLIHNKLEVVKNKLIRRDTNEDQIHVFDAYNFGNVFKAITVKFEDLSIVQELAMLFDDEILKIIPDQDVEFYLPTPANKKNSINKRFNSRAKKLNSRIERRGNYDLFEEDEQLEAASKKSTKKTSTKRKTTSKKVGKKNKISRKHNGSNKHVVTMRNASSKKTTTTSASKASKTTTKKTTTNSSSKEYATTSSKSSNNSTEYVEQKKAEWNLVRTSEHTRSLSSPYIYDSDAGSDSYVYVIDDGMNIDHKEFEGRATWGWSAFNSSSKLGEGHGTHVGGIIGSKTYGIAKKANLIAVQVLNENGRGSISSLLSGLQWVTSDAKKRKGNTIINMSLGMRSGGISSSALGALDNAIDSLVKSGVPMFVAAGNWGSVDACDISPASNKNVYTVGATDKKDNMADFSSYGKCIQILAPGENIESTYIESKTSTVKMSGTSMASPHAAGVAALLMGQLDDPTPKNLYKEMTRLATSGKIKSISHHTVNKLLFNGQKLTST